MPIDPDFEETARQVEIAAGHDFVQGDATPMMQHWSHTEDVTIFGGWGAFERGWDQVGPRLDWAAARFCGGEANYQQIAAGNSGDLGYAIGISRGHAQVVGQDKPGEIALRVTHLFRREDHQWKLIHRHADAITDVQGPAQILRKS